ncbi:MAG: HAMP domain-containing protein [Nitrospirae bacterium]|nr:HAMP domain-containing protein [Nitrospirota bacterium]
MFTRSIRWKFLAVTLGLVVSVVAIMTVIHISVQRAALKNEFNTHIGTIKESMKERARDLAHGLASIIDEALVTFDISAVITQVKKSVETGKHSGEPAYIILMDNDSRALIHTLRPQLHQTRLTDPEDVFAIAQHQEVINEFTKDANEYMEIIVPVTLASQPWGVLRIGYSNKRLNQLIKDTQDTIKRKTHEMIIRSIAVATISIIISAIIALILSGRLISPLVSLTRMVQEIVKGHFSVVDRIAVTSNDEVGILAHTFVEMTRNLRSSHNQLEQYTKTVEEPTKTETDVPKTIQIPNVIKSKHIHTFITLDDNINASVEDSAELNTGLAASPFEELDIVYARLEDLFKQIGTEGDVQTKVLFMANMLMHTCSIDEDIALGTLMIRQNTRYTIKHPLHTAIVCEIVAKKLGWSARDRLSLLSAAITMNIAIIELQEMLHNQKDPLTDQQRLAIESHPLYGMEFLKRNNVTDKLWLNAVMQHHETINGKGYPKGLTGEDVCMAARIVYSADIYCTAVTGRNYRRHLSPAVAIRDIFINKDQKFDADVTKVLMKNLGFYPPGSFVKLKNNEIAVVTQRAEKANAPIVHTVVKSNGVKPLNPLRRDTGIDEFSVKAIATPVEVNRYQLWDDSVLKKPRATRIKRDRLQTSIPAKLLDPVTTKTSDVIIIYISEYGCQLKTPAVEGNLYVVNKSYYITFTLLEKVFEDIDCVVKHYQVKDDSQLLGIAFTNANGELKNTITKVNGLSGKNPIWS